MRDIRDVILFSVAAVALSNLIGRLMPAESAYTFAAVVSLNIGVVLGIMQDRRRRGGDSQ